MQFSATRIFCNLLKLKDFVPVAFLVASVHCDVAMEGS